MFGCGVQSFPPHAAKKKKTSLQFNCWHARGSSQCETISLCDNQELQVCFFWLHLESLAEASFYAVETAVQDTGAHGAPQNSEHAIGADPAVVKSLYPERAAICRDMRTAWFTHGIRSSLQPCHELANPGMAAACPEDPSLGMPSKSNPVKLPNRAPASLQKSLPCQGATDVELSASASRKHHWRRRCWIPVGLKLSQHLKFDRSTIGTAVDLCKFMLRHVLLQRSGE